MEQEQQRITALHSKKHIKIYLLKRAGLKNGEIAKMLGTNAGHVYNALKNYDLKPELKEAAEKLVA